MLELVMRDWRVPMPGRTRATNLRSGVPPAGGGAGPGRPVRVVAAELGLAEATVYRWKAQDLIDRGVKPGLSTIERGELPAAKRRIKELETELTLVKQAAKLFEEGVRPKATYPVIAELASQGFSGQAVLPHPRRG